MLRDGTSEIEAKDGLVKLDRNRCKTIKCITIPYPNDSQIIMDSWLVSYCTHAPTETAKSLTPLLKV